MIHRLVQYLLLRLGKNYQVDDALPTRLLIGTLLTRSLNLLRGLIRFQAFVFVGSRVKVRGGGYLSIGTNVTLEDGVRIDAYAREGVRLGTGVKLGEHSIVSCTSHLSVFGQGMQIGDHSGFGQYCYFGASGGLAIGSRVVAGQYVSFHAQSHKYDDPTMPIMDQGVSETGITIGDDVWIGAKATFLDGSRVGSHSVVAAGALVKDEFPEGAVIAGVPARLIKMRPGFEEPG